MKSIRARVFEGRPARILVLAAAVLAPVAAGAFLLQSVSRRPARGPQALTTPLTSPLASPCLDTGCLPSVAPLPSLPVVLPTPSLLAVLVSPPHPAPVPVAPRSPGRWPMFGFDTGHTGVNPENTGITAANFSRLALSWVDGGPAGAATVADGHVFLPDLGFIHVFADPGVCPGIGRACSDQWRVSSDGTDGADGLFTAAALGGHLVVPDQDGNVFVFAETPCGRSHCTPLWTGQTAGRVSGEVAVEGSTFFVGTGNIGQGSQVDGRLYAFPLAGCGGASCGPTWVGRIQGGGVLSGVASGGGRLYVGDGQLHAFPAAGCGAAECAPSWSAAVSAESAPTYAGGVVFGTGYDFPSSTTNLYAVDAASGAVRWNIPAYRQDASHYSVPHPSVSGGVVLLFDASSHLLAFDEATGSLLWSGPGVTKYGVGPAISGGLVFVALPASSSGTGGGIAAYSLSGCGAPACSPVATLGNGSDPAPDAVVAVTAGRVYTDISEVYALPGR